MLASVSLESIEVMVKCCFNYLPAIGTVESVLDSVKNTYENMYLEHIGGIAVSYKIVYKITKNSN